jgi:hypothetical protein
MAGSDLPVQDQNQYIEEAGGVSSALGLMECWVPRGLVFGVACGFLTRIWPFAFGNEIDMQLSYFE